jgi:hypothetical protein
MIPDTDDEAEFDRLPECFRLALLERARLLGDAALDDGEPARPVADPPALSIRQLAAAAAIPASSVHDRYRVALLRLRSRAIERGL